jgi:hypothetical protein
VNTKNYILESLKYILKKEGFYNLFVVLYKGYRKIKKDYFLLYIGLYRKTKEMIISKNYNKKLLNRGNYDQRYKLCFS